MWSSHSTSACECLEEYALGQVYPGNRSQATPHNNWLVPDAPSNTALLLPNNALQPLSSLDLHVPGKSQISVHALSHPPVTCSYPNTSDTQFIQEVEAFATSTIDQLSATAQHLQKIIETQRNDDVYIQVRGYCQTGWLVYIPNQPYSGCIGKGEPTHMCKGGMDLLSMEDEHT